MTSADHREPSMADEASVSASQGHLSDASPSRKRKKRVRTWTASDRAKHRIFEKGRREAFNERLMDLAGLLPALSNSNKSQLSKHVIVDESVKQHHAQAATIESLTHDLNKTLAEHQRLLEEFNAFREAVASQSAHTEGPAALTASNVPPGTGAPPDVNGVLLSATAPPFIPPGIGQSSDWILDANDSLDDTSFSTGSDGLQVPRSQEQHTNQADMFIDAPTTFGVPLIFDTSAAVNFHNMHTSNFSQEIPMPTAQMMGSFNTSRFPISVNGDWSQNPQMNTFEIFNIDHGGAMHPSIISHG